MPGLPKPPQLPGAELGHYTLFRRIGIDTFDLLGLAEPRHLYNRLIVEVQRYDDAVKLPPRTVVADWVTQSREFTSQVWKIVGPAKVERTMFTLPGENQPQQDPKRPKMPKKRPAT